MLKITLWQTNFPRGFLNSPWEDVCLPACAFDPERIRLRMKRFLYSFLLFLGLAFLPLTSQAQLTVWDTLTTAELLESLFGGGVTVSNIQTTCDTSLAMAEFNGINSNLGLSTGVIISTGNAMGAQGPNNSGSTTTNLGEPGDSLLSAQIGEPLSNAFDACVISFDITPLCDSIAISYVFASEEYPEFAPPNNSSFNDAFGFFIQGPGFNGVQNIALIPNTNVPVSINNVNAVNFPQYYVDNVGGTTVGYDGFTTPLLAVAEVTPCQTYRITLAIQDVGDGAWDSGVFLESGGIGCLTPTLTLSAVNSTILGTNVAVEGCVNYGLFTFQLPQALPDTSIFYFTLGGSATFGEDFLPLQDSILIPAGQLTASLPVFILEDTLLEGPETLEIYYADSSLCGDSIYRDTAVMILWDKPEIPFIEDTSMCSGEAITIGFPPEPGQIYNWNTSVGLTDSTTSDPQLYLEHTGVTEDTAYYHLTTNALMGFCIYEQDMAVIVRPGNFATINTSPDTVCLGEDISFKVETPYDTLVTWNWSFGDGGTSVSAEPVYTYPAPGTYTSSVVVENSFGCADTVTQSLLVDSLPVVNFMVDPVCLGEVSIFVNDIRPGTTYAWEFGDDSSSTSPAPIYAYAQSGTYSALLVATTERGCIDSLRQDAFVYANPEAGFTVENACLGFEIPFTNTSQAGTGTQLVYGWSLGDGTTTTEVSPVHLYADFGWKAVGLVVTDEFGCTDDFSDSVRVYALPEAAFTLDSVCARTGFELENLTTIGDDSRLTNYWWDFGDGRSSTQIAPGITYVQAGLYTISLRVASEFGCLDSTEAVSAIYPLPNPAFTRVPACALDSARFENTSTVVDTVTGDYIASWTWDWGDGSQTGSLPVPGHVYTRAGTYPVILTTWTDKGCVSSRTQNVEIWPLPEAPEVVGDTVCFGEQGFLIAIPGAHTNRIDWYRGLDDTRPFQDGYTFATPPVVLGETYYVQPVSNRGCLGPQVPLATHLFDPAGLELIMDQASVELPQALVNFEVGSTRSMARYLWNFGDGNRSENPTPAHAYLNPGRYQVQVDLEDIFGCQYTLEDVVEVREVISAHVPSAFSPNGDGFNDQFFIQHRLLQSLTFEVYNRWGQRIYQTDNLDFSWNGHTQEGSLVREGVYIYRLYAIDYQGRKIEKTGTITVFH
ncbi:MAG: PKD domain-containing protein [Bacteroidetes bacterium]|nr:MAG: PKD domain-containing protein [Bacteroidota bacterium]